MIVYRSKILPLAVILGISVVGFGISASLGSTDISNIVETTIYFALLLVAIVFVVSLTRVKISDDGILHYSEVSFIKRKARISEITDIDRGSTYRGLSVFGYSMFIYHGTGDNKKAITIGENQFDQKTINNFINDLARINPKIKFHEHYLKMVR